MDYGINLNKVIDDIDLHNANYVYEHYGTFEDNLTSCCVNFHSEPNYCLKRYIIPKPKTISEKEIKRKEELKIRLTKWERLTKRLHKNNRIIRTKQKCYLFVYRLKIFMKDEKLKINIKQYSNESSGFFYNYLDKNNIDIYSEDTRNFFTWNAASNNKHCMLDDEYYKESLKKELKLKIFHYHEGNNMYLGLVKPEFFAKNACDLEKILKLDYKPPTKKELLISLIAKFGVNESNFHNIDIIRRARVFNPYVYKIKIKEELEDIENSFNAFNYNTIDVKDSEDQFKMMIRSIDTKMDKPKLNKNINLLISKTIIKNPRCYKEYNMRIPSDLVSRLSRRKIVDLNKLIRGKETVIKV